jgi:hypothetical protein
MKTAKPLPSKKPVISQAGAALGRSSFVGAPDDMFAGEVASGLIGAAELGASASTHMPTRRAFPKHDLTLFTANP